MLLLFTMPNCGKCKISKQKLNDKNLEYKEIDVTLSKENANLANKYNIKYAGTIIDDNTGEVFTIEP